MAEILENTGENTLNSIEKLAKENETLRFLLKEALLEVETLKERLDAYKKPQDEYNKCWSMVTKIVFLVTKADKPLRSSDIIPLLLAREPLLINKQASMEKYLSAFLNAAMKHKRLIPHKLKGVRGNYYCIPEWVDDTGALLTEMKSKIF